MKICPQCDTEYENNVDVCPKDNTILKDIDNQPTVSEPEIVTNNNAEMPKNSTVNMNTATRGSSALPKALAVIAVLLALGIGLVVWKTKFAGALQISS